MNPKKSTQILLFIIMILVLAVISCQGVAGFNPFATETPLPTSTFTPSPTSTPSPTPTSTPTQTPSPTPLPTGAITEEQSDGSTLFIDFDNQFQFSIPKDWLAIPISSDDLAYRLSKLSEINPDLKNVAAAFADLDPDVIRVIAMNSDPKYVSNGFSTNLTVTAIEDKLMSAMPLEFVTGAVEESLKQGGATFIPSEQLAAKNTKGIEIGVLEFQQTAPTAIGTHVPVHSKILLFHSNSKIIMIQLTTLKQFAPEILPVLDHLIETITILDL